MVNAMPGMSGLPTQAPAEMRPEDIAAFEQMRQGVSPSEFNTDVLSTAYEADPVTVAEFRSELEGLDLPPEALDMLNMMVDEILASPDNYLQIREKFIAQDVPEDLLPSAFDPEFFGALNLAIDYIRSESGAPIAPMKFSRGGIASLPNPLTEAIRSQGRYGDSMLAHVSPREIQMLSAMGGSGSTNPATGLPEFFIKKLFKGVGKALKKVGKAVKKFAQSSVGKIAITMALAFVLGPAAAGALGVTSSAGVAAVSGFVGSSGSTLAAGGSLKDALRAGVVGGLTAGATAGVFGGADAFKAGSYTGPTTVGGQVTKAKEFFTGAPAEAAVSTGGDALGGLDGASTATTYGASSSPAITRSPLGMSADPLDFTVAMGPGAPSISAQASQATQSGIESIAPINTGMTRSGFTPQTAQAAQTTAAPAFTDAQKLGSMFNLPEAKLYTPQTPNIAGAATNSGSGATKETSFFREKLDKGLDKVMPGRIRDAGQANAINKVAEQFNMAPDAVTAALRNGTSPAIDAAYKAAMPGVIRQYAPIAATGLGIMALGGGFEQEELAPPPGFEDMAAGISPGMKLLEEQPEKYGLNFGGVSTSTVGERYNPYRFIPQFAPQAVRSAARGGSMDKEFPRKNGPINGPGTGTSDNIPAMLSDGEFVFTAKAVRGMGDGSRRAGAKKMYALMKKLEGRTNG
jgi:hypothetical protein